MSINPNLQVYIKRKSSLYVDNMIKLEISDPMSLDYYKGYRTGLSDAPYFSCHEAFDLLQEAIIKLEDDNLKNKITKYLNGNK